MLAACKYIFNETIHAAQWCHLETDCIHVWRCQILERTLMHALKLQRQLLKETNLWLLKKMIWSEGIENIYLYMLYDLKNIHGYNQFHGFCMPKVIWDDKFLFTGSGFCFADIIILMCQSPSVCLECFKKNPLKRLWCLCCHSWKAVMICLLSNERLKMQVFVCVL